MAPLRRSAGLHRARVVVTARLVLLLGLVAGVAVPAAAQGFVRQALVVAPFGGGESTRAGRRVSQSMRSALRRAAGRSAVDVVGADSVDRMLRGYGLRGATLVPESDLVRIARLARGDELLMGTVEAVGETLTVRAALVLVRDARQREPLPVVRAVGAEGAADALAGAVLRARQQMEDLRRCENAARAGDARAAVTAAEAALARYPTGLLGRLCLARALAEANAPADSVQRVVESVLARDSANIIAHVLRAAALDGRSRTADAVRAWQGVLGMRPDSAELAALGVERLLALGRPASALDWTSVLLGQHPDDPRFRRARFRAFAALDRWSEAAALGDSLDATDASFASEAGYALRYVQALQERGDTIRAVARSARAVVEHPDDGRLYVQYVRLVAGEDRAGLARGLARFPRLAELRLLAAQRARLQGDRGAERAALLEAIAADGSLEQSHLRVAELWLQAGQADSALAGLARAPRDGAATLRAYTLGRGVELLRGAIDTIPSSYRVAIGFLALADSLDSQDDSRRVVVAAALQAARSELIVAAPALACDGLRRADARLQEASVAIARGVGTGAAAEELGAAQQALRTAVDEALDRGCAAPRPPPR